MVTREIRIVDWLPPQGLKNPPTISAGIASSAGFGIASFGNPTLMKQALEKRMALHGSSPGLSPPPGMSGEPGFHARAGSSHLIEAWPKVPGDSDWAGGGPALDGRGAVESPANMVWTL